MRGQMHISLRYALIVAVLSLFAPSSAVFAQLTFGAPDYNETGTIDTTDGTSPCADPTLKTCFTLNNPSSIAVGDFNNDGKLDIAAINGLPVSVTVAPNTKEFKFYLSVLLGDGTGTFQDPIVREIGAATPCPANTKNLATCDRGSFVLAGKFNADANDDLAIVYFGNPTGNSPRNGKIGIFLSNGDGTFADPAFFTVGLGAARAVLGDFNNDNKLDIAVPNQEENSVTILLGNGDGTFTEGNCNGAPLGTTCTSADGIGKKPAAVATGFFDADGNLDLAVANALDGSVTILKGDGTGKFAPYGTTIDTTITTGIQPMALIAADFNRDGHTDLAVMDQQNKNVVMLLGNGDGSFDLFKKRLTVGKIPVDFIAEDFNGDGVLDLAFVFFPGKLGGVFPGIGDGTFSIDAFTVKTNGGGTGSFAIAAGNFNSDIDDKPDLAVGNGKVAVLLNTTNFPDVGFHITITSPTALTTWTSGQPQTITIDSSGFDGNVRIDFSADGGDTFKTLVKSIANTPTLNLTKGPTTKTTITTARIRVCSVTFPGICGETPNFTLQTP
jgi:FG-GAP-like repeat/FG-GAP repeat